MKYREIRQVWVIEWLNKRGVWETWEIHGQGNPSVCEGGGVPFYKRRVRQCRRRWPHMKFRLVRYVPEEGKCSKKPRVRTTPSA